MRIAIVTPMFPPKYIGGTEISAYNIARELSKRHEVHVVTRRQRERIGEGFETHFVGFPERPRMLKTLLTAIGFFLEIRRIRPDVIYAETLYSGGLAGVLARKLLGIPSVARPVGEIYVASRAERLVLRLVIRNSSLVLAMTRHMEGEVRRYGGSRVAVMPDGVDFEYFSGFPEQGRVRGSVLFVGRLIRLKGVYDMLMAFELVKRDVPGATLWIAGYGEEEQGMRRMARERSMEGVTFLGEVGKEEVARRMKICEVLLLPSVSEGFPLVLVEAMASGMAIVTTRVRGLPEIVADGRNGLLSESGNPADIAGKVKALLADGSLRKGIARRNAREAARYGWGEVCRRLERLLAEAK
jgi:teichuronic acid biosynthesis glycosyltransferase TuaC